MMGIKIASAHIFSTNMNFKINRLNKWQYSKE